MRQDRPMTASFERRTERRRGVLRPIMDALYGTLRWIGGHVRGFYAAVGLFLTLGLTLAVLGLTLFGAVAQGVGGGTTMSIDQSVLAWLREHTSPWLDALALAGAALGSSEATWVVLLAGTVYFWRSRHPYSLALLWIALLGGRLLNDVLKEAFQRPRPGLIEGELHILDWSFGFPESASFPSGHALMSVVIYGTLAYLVARLEPTPRLRRITFGVVGLLIVGIGFSRVYLAVHYPSDVVAGYLAGFVWATFCALGIEAVRYFRDRKPEVVLEEKDLEKGIRPLREAVQGEEKNPGVLGAGG